MSQEKRKFIRWSKKVRVICSFKENEEPFEEVFAEDISESGLQIVVSRFLEKAQVLKLKLEFGYDSIPINLTARVVYSITEGEKYRVGLEFVDVDEFQERRLRQCLEKFLKEPK